MEIIEKLWLEQTELTGVQFLAADVNDDDILDVIEVVDLMVGQ